MIGKWILIFGVLLVVVGAIVWLVEILGLPLGRLPATFGCEARTGRSIFPS